jgi:SAM-dependent methyltransferase
VSGAIWKEFGRQLRYPSGALGGLVGHAMAIVNGRPNRLALDALNVRTNDVALELGFGPGKAIERLFDLTGHGRVLGIDHSEVMLAQATRRNRRAIVSGSVDLRQGSFAALPWPAESVDKILAVNVMYFFGDEGTEIREARRVLRRGGNMVGYLTDARTMKHWKMATSDTHHLFGRDECVRVLLAGGFGADEIKIVPVAIGCGVDGILAVACKGMKA